MESVPDQTWVEETKEPLPYIEVMANSPNGISQINADFYTLSDLKEYMPDASEVGIPLLFSISGLAFVALLFVLTKVYQKANSKRTFSPHPCRQGQPVP